MAYEQQVNHSLAPLNFASVDVKFSPRIWTACAHKLDACLFMHNTLFIRFRQVVVAFLFFRVVVSLVPIGKNKEKKMSIKASFPFAGAGYHCVKSSHPNIVIAEFRLPGAL